MFRIEQGFQESAYASTRPDGDPLVLFANHIHHGRGRRQPDGSVVRIEQPSPEKVEHSKEWAELRGLLVPAEAWSVTQEYHPEWSQVAIWLAARNLFDENNRSLLYERLTILSYPSMTQDTVEAFIGGDKDIDDLLIATAMVGMLKKVVTKED